MIVCVSYISVDRYNSRYLGIHLYSVIRYSYLVIYISELLVKTNSYYIVYCVYSIVVG